MAGKLPRLTVSQNRRFIATEQGKPFFWLGDTAWEIFHRLDQAEVEAYFSNRQANRFNVIQAVALAEFDGLNSPDVFGEYPLVDLDPRRPNEVYFNRLEAYMRLAEARGLYIGLLPTWGDKVTPIWGVGPVVFDVENAFEYGLWLGKRFRDQANIIWVLGGDRPAEHDGTDFRPIWRAMAQGIRAGVGQMALMTYHPMGGHSSSEWLQQESWLDVNMMQSGHGGGHDVPVWEMVQRDYHLQPTRPTLDGEPNYEDHPVNPWPKWDPATGYYRDHDVRKQAYRSVFAGACGVTYGHHSVWQMYDEKREPINHPDRTWREALNRPGATQVQHLRALMESRPYLTRIPDQQLIASDPGEKGAHIRATRDEAGSYAFIYLPETRPVEVRLDRLNGSQVSAQWFDPRSGEVTPIGTFLAQPAARFTPPQAGPDWVLVLDAVSG